MATPQRLLRASLFVTSVVCFAACAVILITCGVSKLAGPWSCYWEPARSPGFHLLVEPYEIHVSNYAATTRDGYPAPLRPPFAGPAPVAAYDRTLAGFESHYWEIAPNDSIWSFTLPIKPIAIFLLLIGFAAFTVRRRYAARVAIRPESPPKAE